MTEETSKKLIKLLTIISIILIAAFFTQIMHIISAIFVSIVAFLALAYLTIDNYLSEFNGYISGIIKGAILGLLIGIAFNCIFKILFKFIPKSQLNKYFEKKTIYDDGEVAIKLLTTPLNLNIDEVISALKKVTKIKKISTIYDIFENENIAAERKYKLSQAHSWLGFIYSSDGYGRFDFDLAVKHYEIAHSIEIDCSLELGKLFYHGGTNSFVIINEDKANHAESIEYFHQALERNKDEASTYIGLILRRGIIKKKSFHLKEKYLNFDVKSKRTSNKDFLNEAFARFEIGSKSNSVAKFYLGAMLYLGEGCAKDLKSAIKFIEESINIFHDEEIKYLHDIYFDNKEFAKALIYILIAHSHEPLHESQIEKLELLLTDIEIANSYFIASNYVVDAKHIEFIKKSSELGSVEAKEELIKIYKFGYANLIEKDILSALKLAEESYGLKSAYATFSLASFYYDGIVVEKDVNKSIDLYKIAADLGSVDAAYGLGISYHYGNGLEVGVDRELAVEYYTKAANKGDDRAMVKLAYLYLQDGNIKDALALLNFVAESQDFSSYEEAHSTLGQLYFSGELVTQNYNSAFYHFNNSRNYADTYSRLGYLYYFGLGTDRNYKLSKMYLEQFLNENAEPYSEYLLGWMHLYGQDTEVNISMAIFYLEKSAIAKTKDAIFLLSKIFLGEFDSTHKDLVQSLKWLYFAASIGFNEAYEKMNAIKEKLSSEGIDKAKIDADNICCQTS